MPTTWQEYEQRLPQPLAMPLAGAAAFFDVDLAAIEAAARRVEPYRHADGSPRWSLRGLRVALGLASDHAADELLVGS